MAQFLDKDGLVKLVANTKNYVNTSITNNLKNYTTTLELSDLLKKKQPLITADMDINCGAFTATKGAIDGDFQVDGDLLDADKFPYPTRKYLSNALTDLQTSVSADCNSYTDAQVSKVSEEIDKLRTKSASYLGTVSTSTELNNLKPSAIGDFCRVSAAFGNFHNGDLLICRTLPTSSAAAVWDVIHGEMDSNTWVANSKTVDGFVTKGSGQANKVWKTDADGNPGWRTDDNTTYGLATATVNGLMSKEDFSKLSGIADGATNVTQTTVSGWGFTKNTGTVTGVKVSSTSTLTPTGGVVDMSTTLTAKQNRNITLTGFASTTVEGCISEALSQAKSYADGIQPDIVAIPLDDITALFAD